MPPSYKDVRTGFLHKDERLMLSDETELPLVIQASTDRSLDFLQKFLKTNSDSILKDIAKYGAVLLRGFDIHSDKDFEDTVLAIKGLTGISDAFMSEEGRIHAGNLKYVLHTNAVYKTGGTLYLGGFHSENYYSTDVPAYISFCCLTPSLVGGETGLVNMGNIYQKLDDSLQKKLEKTSFFVGLWLVSEVENRYKISREAIKKICKQADLPILGEGEDECILMYKPSVFEHPLTQKKSLQINLFEIAELNAEMRKCFVDDYQGKTWFWHRMVWRLPAFALRSLEFVYIIFASFFYSPKNAMTILANKWSKARAKKKLPPFHKTKVGSCFSNKDIKQLAKLLRQHYSSCLWKKGDILIVDNQQIMHAGMPGSGPRLVRALICNPIEMRYSSDEPGILACRDRSSETIGSEMERT